MKKVNEILDQAREYQLSLPPLPPGTGQFVLPVHKYLESALHKPESTPDDVRILCEEALKWQIASVYTNPVYLPLVVSYLKDSQVSVGSIAGFPLGGFPTTTKVFEARTYIEMGASEIDMVISVGQLKAGEYKSVLDEIFEVIQEVHSKGKIVKVILETALLTRQEKITACLLAQTCGADYVKTSTGFSSSGASVEDVDLMRRVVGNTMKVKASADIHTLEKALALILAGADRLGTSRAAQISADVARIIGLSDG